MILNINPSGLAQGQAGNKAEVNKTSIYLIIVNLIPIIGVGLLGWSLFDILLAYWLENIVIAFYTILKITKAQGGVLPFPGVAAGGGPIAKLFIIMFFFIHFGGFTMGHGVFIFALFGPGGKFPSGDINLLSLLLTFVMFMISHGLSYWQNYIGNEEYRRTSALELMTSPYSRIAVMHIAVIGGSFAFVFLGFTNLAKVLVVILKTVLDYTYHRRQHGLFSQLENFKKGWNA